MILERLIVGPLQMNCYLLADEGSRQAVLVDPGAEPVRLLARLARHDLDLAAIWLTHAHFDHVGALAEILDAAPVPVLLHPADLPLLGTAAQSALAWGFPLRQPPTTTEPLQDRQHLRLGRLNARCLHTPGHAPGHIAFHLPDEGLVLAGDALFRGSIGRTDLPYGNHHQLLESIRLRLLTLPPATRVLPGHGPETTIAAETLANPFLTGFGDPTPNGPRQEP